MPTKQTHIEDLLELKTRLKSGEYDGVDIMHAWIAIDELITVLSGGKYLCQQKPTHLTVSPKWPR